MPGFSKKYVKRQGKRAYAYAKKRYVKKGHMNLGKVISDVNRIKQLINVERKRVPSVILDDVAVAQTGAGLQSSGYYFNPTIFSTTQGDTNATRNGASIKPQAFHLDLRVKRDRGISDMKLHYEVFWIPDQDKVSGTSASHAVQKYYNTSTFDGKYDTNSPRNFQDMKGFRTLRKGNVLIKADTAGSSVGYQTRMKTIGIGGKLTHHIKYDVGTDNVRHGSIGIVFTANKGNTANISTGAADEAPLLVSMQGVLYFTDN
jgi:hypothetical protein